MVMERQDLIIYEFDYFSLDPVGRNLAYNGQTIKLTAKEFDILLLLVKNHGNLVTKEALLEQIWPNQFIEENNLAVRISTLRKALKIGQSESGYIQTVSGRGYRFAARVRILAAEEIPDSLKHDTSGKVSSVAVLPFSTLGAHPEEDYLGQGISDALITRLSKIKQLRALPTNTTLRYFRSKLSPEELGRMLRVDLVLSGQIQKTAERIRVTVQLTLVREGKLRWAEKFDEDFTNIFSVEDSISERVVKELAHDLSTNEERSLNIHQTESAQAYQLYLKGRYYWNKRTEEGLRESIEYFQHAAQVDPNYATAYTSLADSYALLSDYGALAPSEAMSRAKAAAMKALAIDSRMAEAYTSLSFVTAFYDWNWSEAEEQIKHAIRLNPNYATARKWYALQLLVQGRFDECMLEIKRAQELEPLSLIINANIGYCLYFSRQYERSIEKYYEVLKQDFNFAVAHLYLGLAFRQKSMYEQAIEELEEALNLSGNAPDIISALGHTYALSGDPDKARKLIKQLKELSESRYISSFNIAIIHLGLGEIDEAFDWLERAYLQRADMLPYIKVDPVFEPFAEDARFLDLIRRIGLVDKLAK